MATSSPSEKYFSQEPAPSNLDESLVRTSEFIRSKSKEGRMLCLVTSGGTMVPLEKNTVRFIDNFSKGTRGASSAENFLKQGYAVIFLSRKYSLQPFMRNFTVEYLVDRMSKGTESDSRLEIDLGDKSERLNELLKQYRQVKEQELLLMVNYTSLSDYLFLLRGISQLLTECGARVLIYLAAAVSDFFVPSSEISEHKIQSREVKNLNLELSPTPKMLPILSREWSPLAFIVTFKLETDPSIIMDKAKSAFKDTGPNHRVVVANLLHETRRRVMLVLARGVKDIVVSPGSETEIEELIIQELKQIHLEYIAETKPNP